MFTSPEPARPAARPEDGDQDWLARRLTGEARAYLAHLPSHWEARSIDEAFGSEPAAGGTPAQPAPADDEERYVATIVALYVGGYMAQLRMLVYGLMAAASLLLFAVASYPFQPERPPLDLLAGLLVAVMAVILYVLIQINRNGLLSRIVRSTPDRFTPDTGFLTSVGTYVLPLLAVLLLHVLGLFRVVLDPLFALLR
jgi:hypothetical protein